MVVSVTREGDRIGIGATHEAGALRERRDPLARFNQRGIDVVRGDVGLPSGYRIRKPPPRREVAVNLNRDVFLDGEFNAHGRG